MVLHEIVMKPPVHYSYTLTFLEQPSLEFLDTFEDESANNVREQIHIHSKMLSCVKQLL